MTESSPEEQGPAILRSAFDAIDAQMAIIDATGTILMVNAAWEAFAAENGGRPWGVGACYFGVWNEPSAQAAAAGIRQVQRGLLPAFRLVYPCHSPRQQRWFTMRVTPLPDDPGSVIIVHQDVTPLVETQKTLQEAEALNQAIVDSTNDMIGSVEPRQFLLLTFNHAVSEYFLRTRGIRLRAGMGLDELLPDQASIRHWRRLFERALRHGTYTVEYEVVAHTNRLRLTFHLLRRDGQVIGISVFGKDVTEQWKAHAEVVRMTEVLEQRVNQRTAQLEAANRELEAFSYSVSHDLRAPLRSIDGFCQALMEDHQNQLDQAGLKHLSRIRHGALRIEQLIEDLLKLSHLNRSEMNRTAIDLSALWREVLAGLVHAQPERRVEVLIQPGMQVQADRRMLLVALENLLGNAWKYTSRQAGPRIQIGQWAPPDGERTFFILDNGAGFAMAQAGDLFKAFHRLHSANEFEGTGIGLAIVQRIINRHGGRVWAEAEPGQGATFYFTLPEICPSPS